MMMYMLFPDAKRKALTFSYDDGVEQDIRLMEIFNKHGLKGTFNLNGEPLQTAEYTWPEGTIHRRVGYKKARRATAASWAVTTRSPSTATPIPSWIASPAPSPTTRRPRTGKRWRLFSAASSAAVLTPWVPSAT